MEGSHDCVAYPCSCKVLSSLAMAFLGGSRSECLKLLWQCHASSPLQQCKKRRQVPLSPPAFGSCTFDLLTKRKSSRASADLLDKRKLIAAAVAAPSKLPGTSAVPLADGHPWPIALSAGRAASFLSPAPVSKTRYSNPMQQEAMLIRAAAMSTSWPQPDRLQESLKPPHTCPIIPKLGTTMCCAAGP